MNNTSPLIPQGATPPRPKSSLYFKILMILSVHVVVIGGMLLQGCKDTTTQNQANKDGSSSTTSDPTSTAATAPNTTPTTTPAPADMTAPVNANNLSNAVAGNAMMAAPAPQPAPSANLVPKPTAADLNPPAAPGEGKEYVIAKGDTFAVIAHKNGLSVKAVMEANPGVDAKKLQVGHKLQIPAGATAATGATAGAATETVSSDGDVYVVKIGDTLSKIAKSHGTTFKRIMAMNDLKTTSIRAGQKLKLPAGGKPAAAEPAVAPSTAPASASAASTPATAPMRVSAAAPVSASPVAAN